MSRTRTITLSVDATQADISELLQESLNLVYEAAGDVKTTVTSAMSGEGVRLGEQAASSLKESLGLLSAQASSASGAVETLLADTLFTCKDGTQTRSYGEYTGIEAAASLKAAIAILNSQAGRAVIALASTLANARFDADGNRTTSTEGTSFLGYGAWSGSAAAETMKTALASLPAQAGQAKTQAETLLVNASETQDDGTTTVGVGQGVGHRAAQQMKGALSLLEAEAESARSRVEETLPVGSGRSSGDALAGAFGLFKSEAAGAISAINGKILTGDGATAGGDLAGAFNLFKAESGAAAAAIRGAVEGQGATLGAAVGSSVAEALKAALTGEDSALSSALATGLSRENLDLSSISAAVGEAAPKIAEGLSGAVLRMREEADKASSRVSELLSQGEERHDDGTTTVGVGQGAGHRAAQQMKGALEHLPTLAEHAKGRVDVLAARVNDQGEPDENGAHESVGHLMGAVAQGHIQAGLKHLPTLAKTGADQLNLHLNGRYTKDGRLKRSDEPDEDGDHASFGALLGSDAATAIRTTLSGQGSALGSALGESVLAALREALEGERAALGQALASTVLAGSSTLPGRQPRAATVPPAIGVAWTRPVQPASPAPPPAPPRLRLVSAPPAPPPQRQRATWGPRGPTEP